jgi:hypothetical protein
MNTESSSSSSSSSSYSSSSSESCTERYVSKRKVLRNLEKMEYEAERKKRLNNKNLKAEWTTFYKFMSYKTEKCYFGSTTQKCGTTEQKLAKVLSRFKYNYNKYLKGEHHYLPYFDIIKCGEPFFIIKLYDGSLSCGKTYDKEMKREQIEDYIKNCVYSVNKKTLK